MCSNLDTFPGDERRRQMKRKNETLWAVKTFFLLFSFSPLLFLPSSYISYVCVCVCVSCFAPSLVTYMCMCVCTEKSWFNVKHRKWKFILKSLVLRNQNVMTEAIRQIETFTYQLCSSPFLCGTFPLLFTSLWRYLSIHPSPAKREIEKNKYDCWLLAIIAVTWIHFLSLSFSRQTNFHISARGAKTQDHFLRLHISVHAKKIYPSRRRDFFHVFDRDSHYFLDLGMIWEEGFMQSSNVDRSTVCRCSRKQSNTTVLMHYLWQSLLTLGLHFKSLL